MINTIKVFRIIPTAYGAALLGPRYLTHLRKWEDKLSDLTVEEGLEKALNYLEKEGWKILSIFPMSLSAKENIEIQKKIIVVVHKNTEPTV